METAEQSAPVALPEGFIASIAHLLGDTLPAFLDSYNHPPLRGVRPRGTALPQDVLGPIPWQTDARYLPLESRAGAEPLHEAGAWYLQEPSAMAAAAALNPEPGDRVLDLCAAPGGKATQLAKRLSQGLLVANEIVPARARVLSRNIERMGLGNAVVTNMSPGDLSQAWPGYFDKILLDAPCSGEGMFRRHPETREQWSAAAPQACAQRQRNILESAAALLRPGGRMAYSTCTFNDVENEGVIQGFLFSHPEFHLAPFSLPGLGECGGMLRLWPHRILGEGHFVALLQKDDGDAPRRLFEPPAALSAGDAAVCRGFLSDHVAAPVAADSQFMGRALCLPPLPPPPLRGIRALRVGLHLGEVKNRLFLPDHALALALPCRPVIALNAAMTADYLHGEALGVDEQLSGWAVPSYLGWQMGFGKCSGGQMKNHYPKGLRR